MMRATLSIVILSTMLCIGISHHHLGYDQDTTNDRASDSLSMVASANRMFAFDLYRKLSEHPDSQGKNVFYSPRSVSLALAALSVGARGNTHEQIFDGLGYNVSLPRLTQADVDQAYRTMLQNNTSSQDASEGTAAFIDQLFKPNLDFLDTLQRSYFTEAFNVDFTKTKESADTINEYVSKKTAGKIDKLVEDLDASTVMYLISYIYFKGKWALSFDPKLTKKDNFTVDANTKVPVDMMNMVEAVEICQDLRLNTTVLHLPFNDSSYSMLLLLPDDIQKLENMMGPSDVTKWLKWMKRRQYDIYVPKFSIKTSLDLKDTLQQMGMVDMFSDRANLEGISEGGKLVVTKIVQKATLDVDEAGATATAATGIIFQPLSFMRFPVLRFDRPFMVLIIDRTTEDPLFVGKIVNPNL